MGLSPGSNGDGYTKDRLGVDQFINLNNRFYLFMDDGDRAFEWDDPEQDCL